MAGRTGMASLVMSTPASCLTRCQVLKSRSCSCPAARSMRSSTEPPLRSAASCTARTKVPAPASAGMATPEAWMEAP